MKIIFEVSKKDLLCRRALTVGSSQCIVWRGKGGSCRNTMEDEGIQDSGSFDRIEYTVHLVQHHDHLHYHRRRHSLCCSSFACRRIGASGRLIYC